ncbi:dienelactone hydrolase family protein [Pseudonocardia sp. RS11V-5]|uniref:dienelactone hydrolase family protein n=1 Tax=Pseudonocardia terrae TaxID=2905831 RepID=UPI001E6112C3|nr:dienelactone hydrolase family protein [Pseudonocardia terrae]MCE3553627.1 dienelactone hydrolase family protein [Pseudonocardia terrae]
MTRYERVPAPDGGEFDAYLALPGSGRGPGVLVFQEIFGINDNIRGICDRLAGEGYVALAPDMFWRLEPRFERKDESALAECMGMVQRLDFAAAVGDITAAFAHLRAMPESTGKVGAIGFCLGGTLTWLCATTARVDGAGIDAAVPYYGSGIHDMLDRADDLECPTLFHYGDRDPFIPQEQIEKVEAAAGGKPQVEVRHYDAGHAFSNWDAPSMYDEKAATEAWGHTTSFLAEHLK